MEIDHRNLQLNAQAMNALFNSLSQEEFDRVSNLETAYEIWNKLAEIHEGISEYKDAKLHFLKIQYETFSMLPHESVNDMYGRLNVIVNDLKGLGANYTDLEVAQKMLRALPEKYETLVTMLINSDMSRMTPASLLGKINTNDMYKLKKKEMEEVSHSKKCIVLQAEVKDKGKGKERGRDSNSNRRRNRRPNKTLPNLRCFECGEKGHFASKCPSKDDDGDKSSKKKSGGYKLMKKLKKEGKNIEAFIGEWDSNEESSASSGSEEEGGDDASSKKKKMAVVAIKEAPSLFAPLCLMAKDSSKVAFLSDSESDDDCDDVSYDELVSMFKELYAYSEKEIVKFKARKKDHASLEVLYEELKTSHERLTISHEKLKEAHDNLLSTTQHGVLIDVGISCDLLDDSAICHIAHVVSSSISTSCDDLVDMPSSSSSTCVSICDASLVVENNELKEQVVKLNKSLEMCFKGRLMMVALLLDMWVPLYSVVNYRTGGSHCVLDSGCTQHMTGDRAMFTIFEVGGKEQEKVTFGDNSKGKVIGLVAKTSMGWLWHRRLAHVCVNQLSKLSKRDLVVGLKDVKFEKDKLCSACQAGKQVACSHPTKSIMSTSRPLELLHMDLFGPTTYKSIGVERKNRTLIEMAMTMLDEYGVSDSFWAEAINTACHATNWLYLHRLMKKTFYERIIGRKPNVAYFRVFGCKCYIYQKGVRLTKFESRCDEGFLLGYASNSKAYRVYNKNKGIVEETADVQFDETNGSQEGHKNLDDVGDEGLMRAMKNMSIGDVKPTEVEDKPSTSTQDEPSTSATPSQAQVEVEEEKAQDPPMPPRIHTALSKDHPIDQVLSDISKGVQTRSRVASICEHYSFVSCLEPKHVDEALCDPDWMNAMHEELNNFARNNVWTLVERLRDHNVIGTKWVFRNKQDENGLVVRNKARLVAQGFTQVEGLDFGETFAPVARLEAIRILLAFALCFDIKLFQMDVKSAFLNGEIAELVFVEQPPGFEDPKNPNHVYKLSKALYGLKQAPRAWYERLRDFLLSKDFKIGKVDTTLFTKIIGDDFFVCQIYVDDFIFGSTNKVFCKGFGDMMSREFEMSMIEELSFFLGLQIKQLKDGTFVSQTKYIKDLLKRFGLEDAKPIKTPMATNGHLDLDEGGKPVDLKLYRSMIGSLLYLTASRPDIMFSVCMCARFQAAPKECHLVAVKRILRYLKHSSTIGLWYLKGAKFKLVGYSDSDYAGCKVDRKSTFGSCQMLGRSLVSWSSKKQNSVALYRRGGICFGGNYILIFGQNEIFLQNEIEREFEKSFKTKLRWSDRARSAVDGLTELGRRSDRHVDGGLTGRYPPQMPPRTRHSRREPTPDPVSEESSGDEYAQSDEEVEANVEGASEEESGDDVSGSGEDEDEGSDDMHIDPSIQFVVNMRNPSQYTILRHHDQFLRPRDTRNPRFHTAFQKMWVAGDYSEMKWMSDTLQCSISRRQFWRLLSIRLDFGDDLHEEHTHNPLSIDYVSQFYEDGVWYTHGKVAGLRTIPCVVNRIVRVTILPRLGNNDDIRGVAWHVIDAIIQGHQFDIVSLMMQEIAISKATFTQGIYYAPYIMRLIQDKLGAVGQNLKKHKQYKPRLQLGAPRAPRAAPSSHPGASSSSAPPPPHGYDPNAFFYPQYAYFGMQPNEYFNPVLGAINTLSESIQRLSTGHEALHENVRGLRTDVGDLNASVGRLHTRVGTLDSRVQMLESSQAFVYHRRRDAPHPSTSARPPPLQE
uniref:OSJNBa0094O15.12 protein n=1 Tax=Oryza sativa subsp. japonica TaxID=39947 RepID=Q7XXJ0_ORYSJ|nr:OSJNBa0094O15.12 [Oryza sativa Japonica Group]